MSTYNSLKRAPPDEVKIESDPNNLVIFTSRDITRVEQDALKYHFPKYWEFTNKHVILSPVDLPSNCIVFNMRDNETRAYVEKHREFLLSRDHCYLKSWHESRERGIPWIEQLSQKELKLCQVHSKIELIPGDIQDFLKYLRSYSKIIQPETVISWVISKVLKVLPSCIGN